MIYNYLKRKENVITLLGIIANNFMIYNHFKIVIIYKHLWNNYIKLY